ncbi:uncharacterized protein LOC113799130 isoform X1 [Dermatophagoides pteronyssinus]|uniref:uncharacterized protein LOC113799130 isoform X1 n=1 Tax=Dermatophagoides pteronyssinus TaxID=6956 RepID=UPI003F675008
MSSLPSKNHQTQSKLMASIKQYHFSSSISSIFQQSSSISSLIDLIIKTIFILSLFITDGKSIHINRFEVPEAVERGHSATLYCDYQLESHEELYAIKFYKNNIEFFRYVPKELTPKQSYKLLGIYVNLKASNSTHVVLSQTNLNSDGLYICEISTEGPIFSTVRSEQLMKIYVLPEKNVQILGIMDQYNYGENISLVCKAGKSWPPVRLEWFINNLPIDNRYVINMTNERSTSTLVTSRIGLNLVAKPKYFHMGILEIKCTATLTIVYEYDAIEHLVTGSLVKNKNKREWSLQPNVRQPVITGMKKNFRLDEILNLNCTTTMQNAQLRWFINQIPANESDLIRYDQHHHRHHYDTYQSLTILGLWLRMNKHLLQMSELQLRCVSYFFKQISQLNSTLKIRTFNHNNAGAGGGNGELWGLDSTSSSSSSDLLQANRCWTTFLAHVLIIIFFVQMYISFIYF